MVNQQELEICRRRGHSEKGLQQEVWVRCKWCGIWLRWKTVMEEREDDPPDSEKDPMIRLQRNIELFGRERKDKDKKPAKEKRPPEEPENGDPAPA